MADQPTADPDVVLEASGPGYWRYRSISTDRRWEVRGFCDYRGHCLIGAVLDDGTVIVDRETLDRLSAERGRLVSDLDVPVLPEFSGCCPLVGEWLS